MVYKKNSLQFYVHSKFPVSPPDSYDFYAAYFVGKVLFMPPVLIRLVLVHNKFKTKLNIRSMAIIKHKNAFLETLYTNVYPFFMLNKFVTQIATYYDDSFLKAIVFYDSDHEISIFTYYY